MEITVHRVTLITARINTIYSSDTGKPFHTLTIDLHASDGHDLTVKAFSDDLGALKIEQPS